MRRLVLGISLMVLILPLLIPPASAYHVPGSYTSLSGQGVSFSTHEGQPVMIEAIMTTCGHCRDPDHRGRMNEIAKQYAGEVTFLMLTISPTDDTDDLNQFKEDFDINWLMGFDSSNVLTSHFDISGTPTTVIVDSDGNLKNKWVGHTDLENYLNALNRLVETSVTFEDTFQAGGSVQGPSQIELFFSNPLVQAGLVVSLLILIYVKSTSVAVPEDQTQDRPSGK